MTERPAQQEDERFEFLAMEERDLLLMLLGEYVATTSNDDTYAQIGLGLMDRIPGPAVNETNEEKVERYTSGWADGRPKPLSIKKTERYT